MSTTADERGTEDWRANLIEDEAGVREIAATARRVAVLGMRTEEYAMKAAFYVPQYLVSAGLEVLPVVVHHPEAQTILGQKVYFRVADVPGPIDIVDVFRRPADIDAHVEDIIAARPAAVWFQSGIRNDRAAEQLARAGVKVVQDRCLMIDHRRARQWG